MELSSGQSLPVANKFFKISSDTSTLAGGSKQSLPVHCRPPPAGVGGLLVSGIATSLMCTCQQLCNSEF